MLDRVRVDTTLPSPRYCLVPKSPSRLRAGDLSSVRHMSASSPPTPQSQQRRRNKANSHSLADTYPKATAQNTSTSRISNAAATAGPGTKGKLGTSRVSHVLCKFHKTGNCTAGASCPFSHEVQPGGRPVCQYFLRQDNCRFGHRCLLAHLREGEPPAMDRKNKKAAQLAAREAAAVAAESTGQAHPNSSNSRNLDQLPSDAVNTDSASRENGVADYLHLGSATRDSLDDLDFGPPDDLAPDPAPAPVRGNFPLLGIAAPSVPALTTVQASSAITPLRGDFRESVRRYNVSPTAVVTDQIVTCSPASEVRRKPHSDAWGSSGPLPARTAIAMPDSSSRMREISPGPFGTSPFSAPGSRSVFLPQPVMSCSPGREPQSAPLFGLSPRGVSYLNSAGSPLSAGGDLDIATADDDDLSEFLPSSLHGLLSERERRKRQPPQPLEESRSVPFNQNTSPWHDRSAPMTHPGDQAPLSETSKPSMPLSTAPFYAPPLEGSSSSISSSVAMSPPLAASADLLAHQPGNSLPQGLAAGLHFQPSHQFALSPPIALGLGRGEGARSWTTHDDGGTTTSALSQRLALMSATSGDITGSRPFPISSPLSRNVTSSSITGGEDVEEFILEL